MPSGIELAPKESAMHTAAIVECERLLAAAREARHERMRAFITRQIVIDPRLLNAFSPAEWADGQVFTKCASAPCCTICAAPSSTVHERN